jgi:hypothetical protein
VDDAELVDRARAAGDASDIEMLHLLHRGARRARATWDVPSARAGTALAPPRRANTLAHGAHDHGEEVSRHD